jgi:hypothetical protein
MTGAVARKRWGLCMAHRFANLAFGLCIEDACCSGGFVLDFHPDPSARRSDDGVRHWCCGGTGWAPSQETTGRVVGGENRSKDVHNHSHRQTCQANMQFE